MQTTRALGRTTVLALTISTAAVLGATNAAACDGDYKIEAGDTLGAIAAKCGTTVAAIERANGVNPRALQLGQTLAIPEDDEGGVAVRESARTRAGTDPAEDAAGFRVGPGDTIGSIAAELGVPVDALIAANDGVNPRLLQIGERLTVPGGEEVQALLAEREAERERIERMAVDYPNPTVALRKGEWRLTIDLEAEGLAPGEPVTVAIRGATGDWVTLGEMPADGEGELIARARIPGGLAHERDLEIALERAGGDLLTAAYAEGATMTASADDGEQETVEQDTVEQDTVEVAGKVVRGGGCSLLVTASGETYALDGDALGVSAGSEIVVSGALGGPNGACIGHEALRVSAVTPTSG